MYLLAFRGKDALLTQSISLAVFSPFVVRSLNVYLFLSEIYHFSNKRSGGPLTIKALKFKDLRNSTYDPKK